MQKKIECMLFDQTVAGIEKKFLFRTKNKLLLGPYTRDALLQFMFQHGQIHPEDEICISEGYWIFCSEKQAVEEFLGVCLLPTLFFTHSVEEPTRPIQIVTSFSWMVFLKKYAWFFFLSVLIAVMVWMFEKGVFGKH